MEDDNIGKRIVHVFYGDKNIAVLSSTNELNSEWKSRCIMMGFSFDCTEWYEICGHKSKFCAILSLLEQPEMSLTELETLLTKETE